MNMHLENMYLKWRMRIEQRDLQRENRSVELRRSLRGLRERTGWVGRGPSLWRKSLTNWSRWSWMRSRRSKSVVLSWHRCKEEVGKGDNWGKPRNCWRRSYL